MASAQSKLEAPETVQPRTGRSIADSFAAFDRNLGKFGELMPLFESIDDTNHKIPHPYFGDMTATEWFAVKIAHEARHLRQIKTLLEKISGTTNEHGLTQIRNMHEHPLKPLFSENWETELNPITEMIIGSAYKVSNVLGCGFLEKVV